MTAVNHDKKPDKRLTVPTDYSQLEDQKYQKSLAHAKHQTRFSILSDNIFYFGTWMIAIFIVTMAIVGIFLFYNLNTTRDILEAIKNIFVILSSAAGGVVVDRLVRKNA